MRHSFKSPRHIHMITLPSGRVIKSDYDISDNEELGEFDVVSEGTKLVKYGAAGSKPKKTLEAASKGAAAGAVAGSIVPGVGTVVGAGVGALVGGISSLLGGSDKGNDLCGKKLPGKFFDKISGYGKWMITGKINKKQFVEKVQALYVKVNVERGILPPGTTIEDLKSGKVIPFCAVKTESKSASAPVDAAPSLDIASIKESISAGSLSKSDIQDALSQVFLALESKKQTKQNLLSSISKNTNKNLSSIKKTLLRSALSNEATSEHNKRKKENAIIRRSDSKQNLMLNRLSAIETALKIKKAKGQALATAFGIPKDYV